MGTLVTEWGNLSAVGPADGKGQMAVFNPQRLGGRGCCNGPQSQGSNQNSLIPTALWRWLVDHGTPGNEMDRKPTECLLDLYKQESSQASEKF